MEDWRQDAIENLLLFLSAWAEFTVGLITFALRLRTHAATCNTRGQDWRESARGRRNVGGSGGLDGVEYPILPS